MEAEEQRLILEHEDLKLKQEIDKPKVKKHEVFNYFTEQQIENILKASRIVPKFNKLYVYNGGSATIYNGGKFALNALNNYIKTLQNQKTISIGGQRI